MPDTLVTFSTPATPTAWQPDRDLFALRRELASAEEALNTGLDDDKAASAYHTANDRFLEAPVHSMAGVLLKLERLAEIEDMEEQSARAPDRLVLNLIRDLRALSVGAPASAPVHGAAPSLDVAAIYRAADEELTEIERQQCKLHNALLLLDLLNDHCFGEIAQTKNSLMLSSITASLKEASDVIGETNNRLSDMIYPLKSAEVA